MHVAAVRVHQVNLRPAVLRQRDGEPAAVGRPRRRRVAAAEIRHRAPLAGIERLHVNDRLLVFERDVREARAVRRPARRKQRLVGRDDRLRIVAVGVGDQQLIARALLGDVGDAGGEDAAIAGELLVDDVGDLVRRDAELRLRHGERHRHQCRLLHDVDQREADLDAAISDGSHRPDDDGVGVARAPHGGLHVFRARRPGHDAVRIDETKHPRSREVGADDARDAERPVRFAVERDDGDRYRGARAADDLDRQLAVRDLRAERRKSQHDKGEPATKQQDHRATVSGSERKCGTHAVRIEAHMRWRASAMRAIITMEVAMGMSRCAQCVCTVVGKPNACVMRSPTRCASLRAA